MGPAVMGLTKPAPYDQRAGQGIPHHSSEEVGALANSTAAV